MQTSMCCQLHSPAWRYARITRFQTHLEQMENRIWLANDPAVAQIGELVLTPNRWQKRWSDQNQNPK